MQCYAKGGCADIIADFAQNSLRTFPDFATRNLAVLRSGVMDVCNGNRIDDDRQCDQLHCPNFDVCDRNPF